MPKRMPSLNPLIMADAVCSECGEVMKRDIKRGAMKKVEKIVYTCINEETGCRYQVESDQRLNGMTLPAQIDDKAEDNSRPAEPVPARGRSDVKQKENPGTDGRRGHADRSAQKDQQAPETGGAQD